MSSAITNTSTTVSSSSNTTASNPKAELQSQDFMKLLLVELKYQDPTSPMDSDKMLTQTSQLSALEAQNATKDAMENMTKAFQTSANFSLASAIGKTADTGLSSITVANGKAGAFDVYLPVSTASSVVSITDSVGNVIQTYSSSAQAAGVYNIKWDGTNTSGATVADGVYTAKVSYTGTDGSTATSKIGTYPIESIKVDGATAYFKVGSKYVDVTTIKEIF
ncbi:MAG TPA: FlgD immunoglobulin-like domain containing protein [Campylobacterales bacterium]|nr:FlgD immunoglobulin-like domain containing protein [Campylobacterales bacterium]